MRLFVGIDLPPLIDQHLDIIKGGIPGARWLSPEQFHITLRFIGEVDGGSKRAIEDALDTVRQAPFSLAVAGVGHFPPSGTPRSIWAGLDNPAPLRELAAKVEHAVVGTGQPPERRNFAPHVTLARLRNPPANKVVQFMQHNALLRTASFEVDAFWLYSSVLSQSGAKYRREHSYPLRP